MLYKGDLVNFDFCVASSEDHEEGLKSEGWIEHHELQEPDEGPEDVKASEEPEEIDLSAYVPVEQFDAVAQKLLETEEQLDTAKGEYIVRINELKKENAILKYSAMDANELKAVLDEKGIKYGSRDGKDTLVKLVLDSEYGAPNNE
ncbi:hypothetical protein ACPIMS_14795 [Acinetobacter baumannii]